ncbi:uncharacterized protein BDR25DRAFT_312250 [Lindgomyces ingoldianus]|uniref:Uncharacterized protein n=1 Tax=Lindgomyces ingoldianus TaxID=673940 RepID=A0ACB6R1G3_9PLEO|nr:uncharacterized protein BDR25DRAFT_312250 [Lindgomyces ingoldianus]KAF2473118.1 hypothetical protein BDR25DRAFT_312250 [Lindgomyces ingoldianus]
MVKRNSDGDVLLSRLSIGLAKSQRLLASLPLGSGLQSEGHLEERELDDIADDIQGPEQTGLGAAVPAHIQDGSFTRRPPTSDHRLLEQLIGKGAAKAHVASKQAPRDKSRPQKLSKQSPAVKHEQSEEEGEGRASAFRSKRQKPSKAPTKSPGETPEEDGHAKVKTSASVRLTRPKSGSYLDDILAERSEKKKKKQ